MNDIKLQFPQWNPKLMAAAATYFAAKQHGVDLLARQVGGDGRTIMHHAFAFDNDWGVFFAKVYTIDSSVLFFRRP